jgi:hypothetical protein
MPLFVDRHDLPDATAADIAEAHLRDREVQERFGVRFVTYWFEEGAGSAFCLVEAPDKEAVEAAHGAAHGMLSRRTWSRSMRPTSEGSLDGSILIPSVSHTWKAPFG